MGKDSKRPGDAKSFVGALLRGELGEPAKKVVPNTAISAQDPKPKSSGAVTGDLGEAQ